MVLHFLKSGYQKLKAALSKTRSLLAQKIRTLFYGPLDETALEKLEQLLYEADLGTSLAQELTEKVRQAKQQQPNLTAEELIALIKEALLSRLNATLPSQQPTSLPEVVLVVGVNGNGKTTSIAKIAKRYQKEGKKVLLGAADTFRAAAMEQLETWASRLSVECVRAKTGSDPAAVAFDAVTAGKARGVDLVLIDTAGRLHNKTPLMEELGKIRRSCHKALPGAPHETLLVLDATTGQNAIDQAKAFHAHTPITGVILTKLDGTAKGGIVVSIQQQLKVPVKFIGVGEGIDDLEPFEAKSFVDALFEE